MDKKRSKQSNDAYNEFKNVLKMFNRWNYYDAVDSLKEAKNHQILYNLGNDSMVRSTYDEISVLDMVRMLDVPRGLDTVSTSYNALMIDPRFMNGEIPEKKAVFYKLDISAEKDAESGRLKNVSKTATKLTYDEAFRNFTPPGARKPEKPRLSFFQKIRNFFSKYDSVKKYDRQMDVFKAKQYKYLIDNCNFKNLTYNEKLLDDNYAKAYVDGKPLPKAESDKLINEKVPSKSGLSTRKIMTKAVKDVLDASLDAAEKEDRSNNIEKRGKNLIISHLEESEKLSDNFEKFTQILVNGKNYIKDGKMDEYHKEFYKKLCEDIGSKAGHIWHYDLDEDISTKMSDIQKEYKTVVTNSPIKVSEPFVIK